MSHKAGVDSFYHGVFLLAVLQLSQAAWLPEPDVESMTLSHQRGLQQTSGCSNSVWQCIVSAGEQMRLSDSTHAAVLAGNCTQVSTSLRLWQCGDNLVRGDLIATVQQGSCSSECIDSDRQLCTAFPAAAPAPSAPMCHTWAVTALISACPAAEGSPLQASQLSSAAAQTLTAAYISYSAITVFPAVVPVQSKQLCGNPGQAASGRHLLAVQNASGALQEDAAGRIQSTAEAVEEQAVAHILGVQDASVLKANVMGGMISATGAEGSARQLMQFITPAGFNRTHYLDLLRRMEALLEAAPPTTAYNRTAILALYQTALQPPSLPSIFFQAPAGAPNAAYTAEMLGFQGGNPIIPAPVAGQEPYLAAVSSALSPASAALYPANLAQDIRNDSITALAPAGATAPGVYQVSGRRLTGISESDIVVAELDAMLKNVLAKAGSGRTLLSQADEGLSLTPSVEGLLHVHAHLLELVSQAPAASAQHSRRRRNPEIAGHNPTHHRHLGETSETPCCCDSPQGFEIHVGADSSADISNAAWALASAMPGIMTSVQPGACMASLNISSLQHQVMGPAGCVSYEQCPDGTQPKMWHCAFNSSGIPVKIEASALLDALPYAKGGLCQKVGPMVKCNKTVLREDAYAAMTNGTCSPACPPSLPCPQAPASAPVLAPSFAPASALAPGPVPAPLCKGGRLPTSWNCTHLGQAFEFDCDSYNEAAPLAAKEKCGLVGITNVLCGGVVMEAVAYQALVEGTCKPICGEGLPEPCPTVISSVPAPAPAPVLAVPRCGGGLPGAWRCGSGNDSLLFDEATYQDLLGLYPGRCAALTPDAMLCGNTLLTPEAQGALSTHACRHTCEKAQSCVLPAPAPVPIIAPAYLTFASRAVPVPAPAPAPMACPIGQYMGQVTCTSGSSVFTADATELDAALKAFQAGECNELNISSTSLIQCGGTLYKRGAFLDALGGRCSVRCLEQEPCKITPAPAPQPEDLIVSHAFVAKRKYQPAPVEAPTLPASAPAPPSNTVCSCSSNDQGVWPGPSITFQYADACPPSGVVANVPDVIYFQANVTFPDSVSILNADVASFTIDTSAPAEPAQCPCGIDSIKRQRISASQGTIQSVTPSGCKSALVVGYISVPVYSVSEASITLSLVNGTVASPCGGVYGAGQASQVVQIRPRPQLFPTNMAFRDGLPTTASATALFTLVFQRPVQTSFGPTDFLISGLFHDAYLQAVPMPGSPEATRIAVDLPQDFCGAASLGLRYPDTIKATDNGAGVCPNGGSSVVTWTRVCGTAGDALIPISAVEVVSPAEADSECAASL